MPGFHHSGAILPLPTCLCRLKQNGIFLQIFFATTDERQFFYRYGYYGTEFAT